MNKLCILSNMTPADWAAWSQAIGALAAIAAALWIYRGQLRAQNIWRRGDEFLHKVRTYMGVELFALKLLNATDEMIDSKENKNAIRLQKFALIAEDLLLWARGFDLMAIEDTIAGDVIELRAVAIEIQNLVRPDPKVLLDTPIQRMREWREVVVACTDRIHATRDSAIKFSQTNFRNEFGVDPPFVIR